MQHVNVLLIDDHPGDVHQVWEMLVNRPASEAFDLTFHLIYAERLATGLARLHEGNIDIILLELKLPDCRGVDTVQQIVQQAPDLPLIVLTTLEDTALALRTLQAGALHYLVKGRVDGPTLASTLQTVLAHRRQRLSTSTEASQLQQLLTHMTEGLVVVNRAGHVQFANRAAETFLGRPAAELRGTPFGFPLVEGDTATFDFTHTGGPAMVEMHAEAMEWEGAPATLVTMHDISMRTPAKRPAGQQDAQLQHTQKMDALRRLASGITHEFNNVLTAIVGYSDLLAMRMAKDDPLHPYVEHISQVSERATQLTRQLAIISRQQPYQPEVLFWNTMIHDTVQMMRALLGEEITLVTALSPNLGAVKADPSQLQQILMNLLVNAQNAMPQGGTLHIETANVDLKPERSDLHLGAPPGPYVMLQVGDTGKGMPPEVLPYVFEPFFTTQTLGKGSGLGLAVVYSIVQQNAGDLEIHSSVGEGTTLRVYLPRASASPGAPQELEYRATVLLVEADPLVRGLMRNALERTRYRVLEAAEGDEALQVGRRHTHPIDVVVTDIVLQGMLGRDLVKQLTEHYPALRVLFTSGHAEGLGETVMSSPSQTFLPKPFTPEMLTSKIRDLLEAL